MRLAWCQTGSRFLIEADREKLPNVVFGSHVLYIMEMRMLKPPDSRKLNKLQCAARNSLKQRILSSGSTGWAGATSNGRRRMANFTAAVPFAGATSTSCLETSSIRDG